MDLTSVIPAVTTTDTPVKEGKDRFEYRPTGAVQFQKSRTYTDDDGTEKTETYDDDVSFELINDDGIAIYYTVKIARRVTVVGEMTVLNINDGDIMMLDKDTILQANSPIPYNQYGYVITGETDENRLTIGDITVPIIFRDLVIDRSSAEAGGAEGAMMVLAENTAVNIAVDGMCRISGAQGESAVYIGQGGLLFNSSYVDTVTNECVDLDGKLNLNGGRGKYAATLENPNPSVGHIFMINGTNVVMTDGENAQGNDLAFVTNEDDERLYPVMIYVDNESAAGAKVLYNETRYHSTAEFEIERTENVPYLADEWGRIMVYRPTGRYVFEIEYGNNMYYVEGRQSLTTASTSTNPLTLKAILPVIRDLIFTDQMTSKAHDLRVQLIGNNLDGDMVIKATSALTGEVITASPQRDNSGRWIATLKIPENDRLTGMHRWNLSAEIGGVVQELETEAYIDMWHKLAITAFKLDDTQIGESEIDHTNKTIAVIMPYDADLETARVPKMIEYTDGSEDGIGTVLNPSITRRQNFGLAGGVPYALSFLGGGSDSSVSRDNVMYRVFATKQLIPAVTGIAFEQPLDYNGGNVKITLTGDNLGSLPNAEKFENRRITVTVNNVPYYAYQPNEGEEWNVTVAVPDNITGLKTVRYPITVSINGTVQDVESASGELDIIVPARIEGLATLESVTIADNKESELIEYETLGTDENGMPVTVVNEEWTKLFEEYEYTLPVDADEDGLIDETGEPMPVVPDIDYTGLDVFHITMPSNTESLTTLTAIITPTNPLETWTIKDIWDNNYNDGDEIDFSNPIFITVTSEDKTNEKTYVVLTTIEKRRKGSGGGGTASSEIPVVTGSSITTHGYVGGYDDGTFRPDCLLTRAEVAALLSRIDSNFDETMPYEVYGQSFGDVVSGSWYDKYIGYLADKGIITGYEDGNYHPNQFITRMEFAVLISRYVENTGINLKDIDADADGSTDKNAVSGNVKNTALNALVASAAVSDVVSFADIAVPLSDISGLWGETQIIGLADAGVISGYEDGTFRPDNFVTRAETITMLNRMLGLAITDDISKYIDRQVNMFSDLSAEHWAYYDIMLAVKGYVISK